MVYECPDCKSKKLRLVYTKSDKKMVGSNTFPVYQHYEVLFYQCVDCKAIFSEENNVGSAYGGFI